MIVPLSRRSTLTIGFSAAAALCVLTWFVVCHPFAAELDASIHRELEPFRTSGVMASFALITALGNSLWANAVSAVLVCYFGLTGRWRWAFSAIFFVQGGMATNRMLKVAFGRQRPEGSSGYHGYSYPSGHTMTAAALLGFVAFYCWRASGSRNGRLMAAALSASLVSAVAVSRVALGVHHLTDVVASLLEGISWMAFCVLALDAGFGRDALTREARQGAE